MQGNVVETLIGAVVLVVAGVFLVFAYSTAGVRGTVQGYELVAKFSRVDGLSVGSDVRVSGIKVGTVTGQTLDPASYYAVVRMTVDKAVPMPEDSSARILSAGLLGASYLALEPGGSAKMLGNGGEIRATQGAVNIMDLIGQAVFGGAGAKPAP
jgi:phospholipid/cholesterol/gamma-HCH transport system substrate-binding protein